MAKVRVHGIGVSIDGFAAGRAQDLEHPLGVGGPAVFDWFFGTQVFRRMHGSGEGGSTGVDNDFALRGFENIGAWILGRNMFGPVRGAWPDESWKGWWGDEPPYRVPAFVLTHHARAPLEMKGGTTFHFVTGGIREALERAQAAAGQSDVRIGGGVATIRQYLAARLIDEMHVAIAPVLLGQGEALFAGLDLPALGYHCVEKASTPAALHVVFQQEKR